VTAAFLADIKLFEYATELSEF